MTPDLRFADVPGISVLHLLADAGHAAFVVGGPVRNALLGLPFADLDIATAAHPQVVIDLVQAAGLRAVPTGLAHGTVTVVTEGTGVEVTTFRRDVETDGRRAVVAFAETILEDAQRRDFTMNALYADAAGALHDPLGGLPDLRAGHVRFIGLAEARIHEDYLRILRFFRFTAWYGAPSLGIDAEGLAACAARADGLADLSRERIAAEMLKLLSAPDPAPAVAAMDQSGVLGRVLPGATAQGLAPLVHLESLLSVPPNPIRRLVGLGYDAETAPLRLSNSQNKEIQNLQSGIQGDANARVLGYQFGAAQARDVLLLRAAGLGQPVDPADLAEVALGATAVFPVRAADLPDLHGPALGAALKAAEADWIASGFTLDKAALLARRR